MACPCREVGLSGETLQMQVKQRRCVMWPKVCPPLVAVKCSAGPRLGDLLIGEDRHWATFHVSLTSTQPLVPTIAWTREDVCKPAMFTPYDTVYGRCASPRRTLPGLKRRAQFVWRQPPPVPSGCVAASAGDVAARASAWQPGTVSRIPPGKGHGAALFLHVAPPSDICRNLTGNRMHVQYKCWVHRRLSRICFSPSQAGGPSRWPWRYARCMFVLLCPKALP